MTRDWVFVEDTCEAVYRAAMLFDVDGHVINVGTGVDTPILDIAHMVLDALGQSRSFVKHVADRPGQVDRHISSTVQAKKLLDWSSETALAQGIERTVRWYADNKDWWKRLLGTETVDVTDRRRKLAGLY
jgi:dTDP-glucose 4,6-dehydratase